MINILDFIKDENLARPFLADDNNSLATWRNWMQVLRALYGLPIHKKHRELVKTCTGRNISKLPKEGFDTALLLCGRRGGKSVISASTAAFSAITADTSKLRNGEKGLVVCVAPSKKQSEVVKNLIRGIFESSALLKQQITNEQKDGFDLINGVRIQILAGDFRSVRGFTLLNAICDEICWMGVEDDGNRIKTDTELVRAIEPALITTKGKLIGISSPYRRSGWAYRQWEENFGNNSGDILVWVAPSQTMNNTLPDSFIQKKLKADPTGAQAEYFAQWRDDISAFISRAVVKACVIDGRIQNLRDYTVKYKAFADISGGVSDSASLAIGHKQDGKVIVDFLKEYKAPFSPQDVCRMMARELRRFGLTNLTGDFYGAEYTASAFRNCGINYHKSQLNKNALYLEFLPILSSCEIELLDDETLINQLCGLQRFTRAGGNDRVDHPTGGKDDVANAVAGLSHILTVNEFIIGGISEEYATIF